jgi:hypothetical protein
LDESISLRPVEPLHCSFLSHGKTPFTNREECSADSRIPPRLPEAPLRESTEFRLRLRCAEGIYFQKRKDSLAPNSDEQSPQELPESDNLALVSTTPDKRQPPTGLTSGPKVRCRAQDHMQY